MPNAKFSLGPLLCSCLTQHRLGTFWDGCYDCSWINVA